MKRGYVGSAWPRRVDVGSHQFELFRGEVFLLGWLNKEGLQYMFEYIDHVIREIERSGLGGPRDSYVLLDVRERPARVRFRDRDDIMTWQEQLGESVERIIMHLDELEKNGNGSGDGNLE